MQLTKDQARDQLDAEERARAVARILGFQKLMGLLNNAVRVSEGLVHTSGVSEETHTALLNTRRATLEDYAEVAEMDGTDGLARSARQRDGKEGEIDKLYAQLSPEEPEGATDEAHDD